MSRRLVMDSVECSKALSPSVVWTSLFIPVAFCKRQGPVSFQDNGWEQKLRYVVLSEGLCLNEILVALPCLFVCFAFGE